MKQNLKEYSYRLQVWFKGRQYEELVFLSHALGLQKVDVIRRVVSEAYDSYKESINAPDRIVLSGDEDDSDSEDQ